MESLAKESVLEVLIHGMSHDGRGVGRLDSGMTVFVQGALTGQKVIARVLTSKKRMIEAVCVKIIEKSPFEVTSFCEHAVLESFPQEKVVLGNNKVSRLENKNGDLVEKTQSDVCGGCPLIMLQYEKQLEEKTNFVKNALVRIGHFEEFREEQTPKLLPILSVRDLPQFDINNQEKSLTQFRNKMEFAFKVVPVIQNDMSIHAIQKKTDKVKKSYYTTQIGLKKRASHEIMEVHSCALQKTISMEIVKSVRAYCTHKELPFLRYLVVRTPSTGQVTVELITWPLAKNKNHAQQEAKAIEDIARIILAVTCADKNDNKRSKVPHTESHTLSHSRSNIVAGFIHSVRNSKLDVAYGERIMREWGETSLTEKIILLGEKIPNSLALGNKAFFQVNTPMANILFSVVYAFASHVLGAKNNRIWDIYCGVGSIASCLLPLTYENKKNYFPVGILNKDTLHALCPLETTENCKTENYKDNESQKDFVFCKKHDQEKSLKPSKSHRALRNKNFNSLSFDTQKQKKSTKPLYPFLLGLESVSSAVALAKKNLDNLKNTKKYNQLEIVCETADAKYLGQYLKKYDIPDLIVLDPPRAGLEELTVNSLLKYSIPYCIIVSCNPTTLARDLDLLSHKYDVCAIQPVDLFPHTMHVESVSLLKRKNKLD